MHTAGMSAEAASAAVDRISSDEALGDRIGDDDPGGALEIIRGEGFDVSREEMRDAIVERYGEQFEQEELDAIAGGELGDLDMAIIDKVGGLYLFLIG